MSVIYLLIPLSIIIAACFLAAFIWAVRSGQFEDTYTPSVRMLWEDRGANKSDAKRGTAAEKNQPPTNKDEQ